MIQLYNEDNLKVLQDIDSKSIDCIYCDILFNTGKTFSDFSDNLGTPQQAIEWYNPRFIEMKRVLKDSGVLYIPLRLQVGTFFRKGNPTIINGQKYYKDSELFPVKTGLPKGTSDLIAIQPVTGRAVFIECKIKYRKPTPEQLNFIEVMRKQGALAGVCYSVDDVKTLLKQN